MKLFGAFRAFVQRVLKAVEKGGLPKVETKKLEHLLTRTGKRNIVLAKGILTALAEGGATKKDIRNFGKLLESANQRILEDKPPFTEEESKELATIFRRASLTRKTTRRFQGNLDELLAEQINESIGKRVAVGVPKKKTVRIEKEKEKIAV